MLFVGQLIASPSARWLALAGLFLAFLTAIYFKGHSDGKETAVSKINQQTERAISEAHEAARNVDDCYATGGMWSIARAECERDFRPSGR